MPETAGLGLFACLCNSVQQVSCLCRYDVRGVMLVVQPDEGDVQMCLCRQYALAGAIGFPDVALHLVAIYGMLEEPLRYGDEYLCLFCRHNPIHSSQGEGCERLAACGRKELFDEPGAAKTL